MDLGALALATTTARWFAEMKVSPVENATVSTVDASVLNFVKYNVCTLKLHHGFDTWNFGGI